MGELLLNRFVYYDRAELRLVYEENAQLRHSEIETKAFLIYVYLQAQSSRRPGKIPKVSAGRKLDEPCLSVVDCLLGVFGGYATNPKERQQGLFERVRDQYRLIVSVPTGKFFTRKQPFVPWPNGDPTA
jgi:hypothetical protein